MINNRDTYTAYGYHVMNLSPKSNKPIIATCDGCGAVRITSKLAYKPLCRSCAAKRRDPNTRPPMPSRLGVEHTHTTREKMRKPHVISDDGLTALQSDEKRMKRSAAHQGIPPSEWCGYIKEHLYCVKFNESCRERNRERYDRECFMCGKTERENGKKLSVHHVDRNKQQGCDGHDWALVPLCMSCHGKAHNHVWQTRLEYLITLS